MPRPAPAEFSEAAWKEAGGLSCRISVEIPVIGFTVGDLLRLEMDSVVNARMSSGANVSLKVNGQLIGWAEFEVMGDRVAVRLTEIA